MIRKKGELDSPPDQAPAISPTVSTLPISLPGATALDDAVTDLSRGASKFSQTTTTQRIELAKRCLQGVFESAPQWVDAACKAKGIAEGSPPRAEEVTAGPLIAARHLQLIIQSLSDIDEFGAPRLPGPLKMGPDGRLRVPVAPVRGLFDPLLFPQFKAHAWMQEGMTSENLFAHLEEDRKGQQDAKVSLVLGAGNVSAISAMDTFSKLFCDGDVVLLKMHPVNEYLGPIFQRAFAPLITRGYLRIVYGGADVGATAISHDHVDRVHMTGSLDTHDTIVWGPPGPERERRLTENRPALRKPISSELGNVTPWIIVPGNYSRRQLLSQAQNIAASIVNNASFNCAATRVLITPKRWAHREALVDAIEQILASTPRRTAYYPGAVDRYRRFTGMEPDTQPPGTLPWTLLRNIEPDTPAELFRRESFVSVCAEVPMEGNTASEFLDRAVTFANEKLWGTLCAAVTVSPRYRSNGRNELHFQQSLSRLRYGCVGINQWPGLMFGLVSPPWGGAAGSDLADVQSGIGWSHNTYMLQNVEKTVLDGPLTVLPKPIWFPSHGNPEPIAWAALDLYHHPSAWHLSKLLCRACVGHFTPPVQVPS
jgi:acyl-CoA reductase-like NAD-dependent aldehyde dehydrogenase